MTLTGTGGGSPGALLHVERITGLPTYPISSYLFGLNYNQLTFPSGTVNNIPVPEPNNLALMIVVAGTTPSSFPTSCPPNLIGSDLRDVGSSTLKLVGYTSCAGVSVFANSASGPTSITGNYTGYMATGQVFYLTLRTQTPPSPDFVQLNDCSNAATGGTTSITCAMQQLETVGHHVMVGAGGGGPIPIPVGSSLTNTDGWPCQWAVPRYSAAFGNGWFDCPVTSVGASPNSFTFTTSGSAIRDILIEEDSSSGNLWGSPASNMISNTSGTPSTTQSAGPIFSYQAGTVYFPGFMAFSNSLSHGPDGVAEQVTPTPPFRLRIVPQFHGVNGISFYADAQVTNSGGTLAQSGSVTTTTSQVNAMTIFARGNGTYNFPVAVANDSQYNSGSSMTQVISEPSSTNCVITIAMVGTPPYSIHSTPTLSWTNETNTTNSAIFDAFSVPAGTVSLSIGASGSNVFATSVKFCGFTGVDVKNSVLTAGLSAGPLNVTTNHANEYGFGVSSGIGTTFGANNFLTGCTSTQAVQMVPGTSDSLALSVYSINAITQGNYCVNATTDDSPSSTGAAQIYYTFTAPPPSTGLPYGYVFTKNYIHDVLPSDDSHQELGSAN